MASPNTAQRPVDLMLDLCERMVRIETKLDIRIEKDVEVDLLLAALTARTTAIETQAVVLKTHINTLRWVGGAALAFIAAFGSTFSNLLHLAN